MLDAKSFVSYDIFGGYFLWLVETFEMIKSATDFTIKGMFSFLIKFSSILMIPRNSRPFRISCWLEDEKFSIVIKIASKVDDSEV